jgi:hypothetical protein
VRRPNLTCLSALLGAPQNDTAPMIVGNAPILDFLQGSKAAEADETVVQAAISYAGGLNRTVDITH